MSDEPSRATSKSSSMEIPDWLKSSYFKRIAFVVVIIGVFLLGAMLILKGAVNTNTPLTQPVLVIDIENQQRLTIETRETSATDVPFYNPFDLADPRPRISIILTEIGLNEKLSELAITDLPQNITFSISPYAKDVKFWGARAVQARHEYLLSIPMQPQNILESDAGSLSVMQNDRWNDVYDNLRKINKSSDAHIGYINSFANDPIGNNELTRNFLSWIATQDRMFIEHRINPAEYTIDFTAAHLNVNHAAVDIEIDAIPLTEDIIYNLRRLESMAQNNGYAIGVASAYPITIEVLKQWAEQLDDNRFVLAPISASLNRKKE